MEPLTLDVEPIDSSGALSVYYAAVDELQRRYGGTDDDEHLSMDELAPPRGLFVVARQLTHPVGGVGVRPIGDPTQHLGEIKRLWVRPDLRRGGVAAQLMVVIEARARSLGLRQLYLETGPRQPEAIAFYPKTGWRRVESFPAGAFTHDAALRFTKVL